MVFTARFSCDLKNTNANFKLETFEASSWLQAVSLASSLSNDLHTELESIKREQ